MALNFDIRDPKNQRILASFLVPVVLFYAFYNFMLKPKIGEIEKKKTEIASLKKNVTDIKNKLDSPEKLAEEKTALESKLAELEQLLPTRENVSLLLDQFSQVETDSKVYMVGFEATESVDVEGELYRSNKYKITIESGYHQFSLFMSYAMRLPRILSFSEITISANSEIGQRLEVQEGLEDQPRNLTIECIITSYIFKPPNKKS